MLPVHITPFLYKSGGKNIRVCPFTFILLITNAEPKISNHVRSHCSGSVKLIVECWSVFRNLRFCALILIQSVFKNLRLCGYPLSTAFLRPPFLWRFCAEQCENFHKKRRFFSPCLYKNGAVCELGLNLLTNGRE